MIKLTCRNLHEAIPALVNLLVQAGKQHPQSDKVRLTESVELVLEHPEECIVFHGGFRVNPWDLLVNALWTIFERGGRNPVHSENRGDVLKPWFRHIDFQGILANLPDGYRDTENYVRLLQADFGDLITGAPIWGILHHLERRKSLHIVLTDFREQRDRLEAFSAVDTSSSWILAQLEVVDWRTFIAEGRAALQAMEQHVFLWGPHEPFFQSLNGLLHAQEVLGSLALPGERSRVLRSALDHVNNRPGDWSLLAERWLKDALGS